MTQNYQASRQGIIEERHWYKASQGLARVDRSSLQKLISRIEKSENFMNALNRKPEEGKVVIQFTEI